MLSIPFFGNILSTGTHLRCLKILPLAFGTEPLFYSTFGFLTSNDLAISAMGK